MLRTLISNNSSCFCEVKILPQMLLIVCSNRTAKLEIILFKLVPKRNLEKHGTVLTKGE